MDNLLITKFGSFNISISCCKCCIFQILYKSHRNPLGDSLKSQKTNNFTQIFFVKNQHDIRISLPIVIRTLQTRVLNYGLNECGVTIRFHFNVLHKIPMSEGSNVAGLSSSHQLGIAGLMGLLSSQNSNANQPNIAGPIGSHTNTGKAVVMGIGYPSWRLRS